MKDKIELSKIRRTYNFSELLEENIETSPFKQFQKWIEAAHHEGHKEPNAMVLSTIFQNKPHARIVLLKGFAEQGFSFFTNYNSQKGQELEQNAAACLTFFWDTHERQVRIEGNVEKVSALVSDEYFWSRPRESQIGAWVSQQSELIENRLVLDQQLKFYEQKFKYSTPIPRPAHWGGYILKPDSIEFWQGRPNRLHDRLKYEKVNGVWKIVRLSP